MVIKIVFILLLDTIIIFIKCGSNSSIGTLILGNVVIMLQSPHYLHGLNGLRNVSLLNLEQYLQLIPLVKSSNLHGLSINRIL